MSIRRPPFDPGPETKWITFEGKAVRIADHWTVLMPDEDGRVLVVLESANVREHDESVLVRLGAQADHIKFPEIVYATHNLSRGEGSGRCGGSGSTCVGRIEFCCDNRQAIGPCAGFWPCKKAAAYEGAYESFEGRPLREPYESDGRSIHPIQMAEEPTRWYGRPYAAVVTMGGAAIALVLGLGIGAAVSPRGLPPEAVRATAQQVKMDVGWLRRDVGSVLDLAVAYSADEGRTDNPNPQIVDQVRYTFLRLDDIERSVDALGARAVRPSPAPTPSPALSPPSWVYAGERKGTTWIRNYFVGKSPPAVGDEFVPIGDLFRRDAVPQETRDGRWKKGRVVGVLPKGRPAKVLEVKLLPIARGSEAWWVKVESPIAN